MSNPFDRYEQHLYAYPARPWWLVVIDPDSTVQTSYPPRYLWHGRRIDGQTTALKWWATTDDIWEVVASLPENVPEQMAQIDKDNPLPVPEPHCLQVWVFPDGSENLVVRVNPAGHDPWPPRDMSGDDPVLVAGPGAPWAPPDWSPPDWSPDD